MSTQDLVDRNLVTWETRRQAGITKHKDEILAKYGRDGYDRMLARAQQEDEMAAQAYHSWAMLSEQTPTTNASDQKEYLRGLDAAKKRALQEIQDPRVRADVQKRIEGELQDVLDAAKAFGALKDQFGMTYGSPEDAMQEFVHRPEAMQGALGHVMGGFSDFRRFWDEIRPDVERLRQMNPGDEGAVEQAVAGSTLSKAMGMLLQDSTSRMTVKAATGGQSIDYVLQRFLKGLDKKDQQTVIEAGGNPETAGKMRTILEQNRSVPFVKRLLEGGPKPLKEDGYDVTHKMAQSDNYAYPTVVEENGKLVDLVAAGRDPFQEAIRRGDAIQFDSPEEALAFSKDYKQGTSEYGNPFARFAQARALYIQGAASAEQIAAQNAKEKGTTYREELSKQGAVLNALHEKLVEMKAGLPEINRQAALWIPPDAKGFQENPGPVSTFFRGMARGALSAINPFANQGQLALVAPRTQNPEHKAGFIPWNAQAWGEAVAELGVSTPGFMAGGEVAGGVKLAKPLLQRAAQGAVAGGVGMMAQPGAVKEAATGDVPGLARRGLGGAVAGGVLGAGVGAVEKAIAPLKASRALTQANEVSSEAAKAATPTGVTGQVAEAAVPQELSRGAKAAISRSSNLAKRNTPSTVRNLTLKERIIEEARRVEPFRKEQRKLFTEERGRRASIIEKIGEEDPTEVGFFRQLKALEGELPKPDFGKPKITPNEFRQAIVTIQRSDKLALFEKLSAKKGFLAFREGYLPEPRQRDYLERVFGPEVVTAMEEKVFGIPHLGNKMSDVLGLTRGMKAMGDYTSMALRQGAYFAGRHPREWAQALGRSWKNAFSPKNQEAFNKLIVQDPDYKLANQAGLNLPSIASKRSGRLSGREETFQNDIGEKLPWLLGGVYRSSQRSAETFLTQFRMSVFKATKDGIDVGDEKALKALGDYINTFSGRASLGKYEQAGELLAKVGFAPRFSISRLQAFNPAYYVKLPPAARKHALESALTFHAARTALLGVAASGAIPGVKVGLDRHSADFGKLIIGGKTRVDAYAGYQQIARTIDQLLEGVTKSTVTGKITKAGTKKGKGLRWRVLTQFFQSRQHPVVGFIHDQLAEEDFVGRPIDTSAKGTATRAIEMYEPLIMQDMRDLLQEKPELFPILFPATQLGIGVQTYPLSKDKK